MRLENKSLLRVETGESNVSFTEEAGLVQGRWFPESGVTMHTVSILDKPGLHFFEGEIVQKFGEDFVLVSDRTHSYHLSHEKFNSLQPGDKVSMQVQVSTSGARDTIAVWPLHQVLKSVRLLRSGI